MGDISDNVLDGFSFELPNVSKEKLSEFALVDLGECLSKPTTLDISRRVTANEMIVEFFGANAEVVFLEADGVYF